MPSTSILRRVAGAEVKVPLALHFGTMSGLYIWEEDSKVIGSTIATIDQGLNGPVRAPDLAELSFVVPPISFFNDALLMCEAPCACRRPERKDEKTEGSEEETEGVGTQDVCGLVGCLEP